MPNYRTPRVFAEPDGMSAAAPAFLEGDASVLHQCSYLLNNTQVKALPTTPVMILPAPGANKAIVAPVLTGEGDVVLHYDRTSAFSNVAATASIKFYLGDSLFGTSYGGDATLQSFLQGSGDAVWLPNNTLAATVVNQVVIASFYNLPLYVSIANAAAGAITGGHSTNTLRVAFPYRIFDLASGRFE